MSDSKAREAILGRVYQALRTPSPPPHWEHEPIDYGPLFSMPEPIEAALRERFRSEFVAVKGEWYEADSVTAGLKTVRDIMQREGLDTAIAPHSDRLHRLLAELPTLTWVGRDNQERAGWDKVDLGITLVDALVAESGTVVIGAQIAGRSISVLPPVHLAVATADDLVSDLDTAIDRVTRRYDRLPSSVTFISGPSRTADIEKTLVLGAHGPKRLMLLMLPAGSLD